MAEKPMIKVLGFFQKAKRSKDSDGVVMVDYVRFSPAQALNAQITEERVNALRPRTDDDPDDDQPNRAMKRVYMDALWSVIGPAYDMWKQGHEIPATGMPLAAWAGVTKEQADVMRKIGINTVEELSTLEDGKLSRMPMPNAREVRDLARRYLKTGDDTRTTERLADLEASNKALQEQLAAAMELLEEHAGKKRGRPAKAAEPVGDESEAA